MAKNKNKQSKNLEKQSIKLEEIKHNLYLTHHKVNIIMSRFDNISNFNTLTHVVFFAGGVIITLFFFGVLIILKKWGL